MQMMLACDPVQAAGVASRHISFLHPHYPLATAMRYEPCHDICESMFAAQSLKQHTASRKGLKAALRFQPDKQSRPKQCGMLESAQEGGGWHGHTYISGQGLSVEVNVRVDRQSVDGTAAHKLHNAAALHHVIPIAQLGSYGIDCRLALPAHTSTGLRKASLSDPTAM